METERPSASNGDDTSVGTCGLTPLDEERARSMADEGGASAAAAEASLDDRKRRTLESGARPNPPALKRDKIRPL